MSLSIVVPAKNEAASLVTLIPRIRDLGIADEIVLVDDGSTDGTAAGAKVVRHRCSMGNGAAVKSGVQEVPLKLRCGSPTRFLPQ